MNIEGQLNLMADMLRQAQESGLDSGQMIFNYFDDEQSPGNTGTAIYRIGDVLVRHSLAVSKRGAVYEAVFAFDMLALPEHKSELDHILCYKQETSVRERPGLFWLHDLKDELRESREKGFADEYFLLRKFAQFVSDTQKRPAGQFRRELKEMLSGENVAAFSGGLPTLGKRR